MKHLTLFAFNFFLIVACSAQMANNWYFGANAGLTFNTNPPSLLLGGQINNPDNTSTISDAVGNLLFYTDGVTVWDNNHVIMQNGTGLLGSYTAGQGSLIVPIPCSLKRYAIFTTTEFSAPGYLSYSVVDMSLNGGLGGVMANQKNISLGTGWTEKLCAFYNASGNNYWVLSHKWNSTNFAAFSVSSAGVSSQAVVSSVGSNHNCGTYSGAHDGCGQLTISPNGLKVVNALSCQDIYEIFDFDANTGLLSNPITLPGNGGTAWGTAFSGNSQKLYTTSIFGQSVYQYDISSGNLQTILSSKIAVASVTSGGYNFGYMELGPNGKLYITRPNLNYLTVVNNPDLSGLSSNLVLMGQTLGNKLSTHGLSRIAYNYPLNATIPYTISPTGNPVCAGQSATLYVSATNSCTWSTGAVTSSLVVSPISDSTFFVNGTLSSGCSFTSALTVSVSALPVVSVLTSGSLCEGTTATLTAQGASSYTWNSGAQGPTLLITPLINSTYTVTGANNFGCENSQTIAVAVLPVPVLTLVTPGLLCAGTGTTLVALGASTYTWNSGVQSPSLPILPLVNTSYTVSGTNEFGCETTQSLEITVAECTEIVENIEKQNFLDLYPNPCINRFFIHIDQNKLDGPPVFHDVLGTLIYPDVNPVADGLLLVEMNGIPAGIYFVSCSVNNKLVVLKVMKI